MAFDSYADFVRALDQAGERVLLFDRATRDDRRCRTKYGPFWDDYCERVPYKIVPYVY